ncbi:MAG: N-acetyl-gamma-glutamyl-phosphate reductase, partial [Clostridia bacterium]
ELVRLLQNHPQAKIVAISSVSYEGKSLSDIYPNMLHIDDNLLVNEQEVISKADVVFTSLPHGLSEAIAKQCVLNDVKLIDLGADFRLSNENDYKLWYDLNYTEKALHSKSCYCIPELHKEKLANVKIVGNPGCYPTSVGLGLAPSLVEGIIDTKHIIIDSKSGVTGAGRGLTQNTHYPDCNEAFGAYKVAIHRHTPEIEEVLSGLAKAEVKVTFVPHLLPINRGIESTIYANLLGEIDKYKLRKIYTDFYKYCKFVRVLPLGNCANIKNVKYSNYCDISLHIDDRTNTLIVCSVIDNMVKGASGQAIQNMNILFQLDEYCGLDFIPPAF